MKKIITRSLLIIIGILIGGSITIYLTAVSASIDINPKSVNVSNTIDAEIIEAARSSYISKDPAIANMVCTRLEEKDFSYDVEFSIVCEDIKIELLFGAIGINKLATCSRTIIEVKKSDIMKDR